jgi:hypothetical protein
MYQMAVEKCTTLVINIAPILGACQERFLKFSHIF